MYRGLEVMEAVVSKAVRVVDVAGKEVLAVLRALDISVEEMLAVLRALDISVEEVLAVLRAGETGFGVDKFAESAGGEDLHSIEEEMGSFW